MADSKQQPSCSEFCMTDMRRSDSNYDFFVLFLSFKGFWTRFWQKRDFVCGTSNLFLAVWSSSQRSPLVSGVRVAVVGCCWTALIEHGCTPILAPCHISTEQRTLSQLQILAAGHFLAGGISTQSQTYMHMGTETHTNTRRGQMRHRLSGGGWLRCEHVNDRRMDENNQAAGPSGPLPSDLWIREGKDLF